MAKIVIGSTEGPKGTNVFLMNDGNFEIQTAYNTFSVSDSRIETRNGKYFYDSSKDYIGEKFGEIEIPKSVIELKEKETSRYEMLLNSIGITETTQGTVYFSINTDCQLIAKLGEKAIKTDKIYNVEGKKAIFIPELGLDFAFLEIPVEVEIELKKAKRAYALTGFHLIYVGRSLLTGKDYYNFNVDITQQQWDRVKNCFEYFGDESNEIGLTGWLTSSPGLVEEYLRIRNPIASRKEEIDKQKAKAEKANVALIKKLSA